MTRIPRITSAAISVRKGCCHSMIAITATSPSSATLATPLLIGSGEASIAYRNPSFVVCVVTARPPPTSAATSTKAGSPCHAVAAARAAAAGGRISECTVSQIDATAGSNEARNSTIIRTSATPITHQDVKPDKLLGNAGIHPNRAPKPTTVTVAYRFNPAANAIAEAWASICNVLFMRHTALKGENLQINSCQMDLSLQWDRQSTNRKGITRHRYVAGSDQPSGSTVAARSGARNVSFTSSVGI